MSILLVHELHEARDRILLLKQRLEDAKAREIGSYQDFIDDQIRYLDDALEQARIPERYRVAIVGRFKVGKSAFVNKLTGERLAGVDTNPETAAISIFRYGEKRYAEVELVSREDWEQLELAHKEDPKDPEVKRYDRFITFNERKALSEGKEVLQETFDLHSLASKWVRPDGLLHRIDSDDWTAKDAKKRFTAEIKKFTSTKEPLHYLVNKLTIYGPIPILRDQIELIDTPGLDDTEKFRVLLTEELVKDVDALLFLTVSGASYSQTDKEFIVRQLRQRQIKHLQLIVTKADETYENAVRDARENEEDDPSYEVFTGREIDRVRSETKATLKELLQSNELTDEEGYYYIQQLDNLPIHLISAKYHDEGLKKNEDQLITRAGIESVRDNLYRVLSTSQRFEHSRTILMERLEAALRKLRGSFKERLGAIERDFDPKKVKEEIEAIREALASKLDFFASQSEETVDLLKKQQAAFRKMLPGSLDHIGALAALALRDLREEDLMRHWRTRRSSRWGYLGDLQDNVADRIFPRVESLLNTLCEQMKECMSQIGTCLERLQIEMCQVEEEHRLSGLEPLSLAASQMPVFSALEKSFSELTENERDGIVSRLEDFVTDEVSERLATTREEVRNIRGTGTTWRQSGEVKSFYDRIQKLLVDALKGHLQTRVDEFAQAIVAQVESVAPRIRQASDNLIHQRLVAIESSLVVATTGQKEQVSEYLQSMVLMLSNFAAETQSAGIALPQPVGDNEVETGIAPTSAPAQSVGQPEQLRPISYEIPDNATGYTYESIFRPYIDDAEEIIVEDPYIKSSHQVDNFARFCALAVRIGVVKQIILKSSSKNGESDDDANSRLETLRRDLSTRGIDFSFSRVVNLHNREICLSNGWTIKIDRGLDIYIKPESWVSVEAADFSLRRCRQTRVDIFKHSVSDLI